MNVQGVKRLEHANASPRGAGVAQGDSSRALIFRKTIEEAGREQLLEKLGGLISDINSQGERLARRADITELEKYRSLIRDFFSEVVSNGYEFTREGSFAARGRQRFFATVKKVDVKLEELAEELLREQKDDIAILDKIGEISGLLVDIFL